MANARAHHPWYFGSLCLLHIYSPRGFIRSGTIPRKNVHRARPVNLYSITVKTNAASDEKWVVSGEPTGGGRRDEGGGGVLNCVKNRTWPPDSQFPSISEALAT